METIQSLLIYVGLLIISIFLADYASKRNKKSIIFWIIFNLSLISGLRAISVGIDTKNYAEIFQLINEGKEEYVYTENTFKWICKVLLFISESPNFLLFVFSVITNGFITLRLWDFRKSASFPWSVFCYYCSFFFMTLNIMRQFCAIAIIFFGTRYLKDKNYFKFVILVLMASLFHISALLGFSYFAVEILFWKKHSKSQKKFLINFIVVGIIASSIFISSINRYTHYFENASVDIGMMVLLKLLFFILTAFIFHYNRKKNFNGSLIQLNDQTLTKVEIYYAFGLILSSLGYIFSFMDRIGLYFYLFEAVYMGIIVKNQKDYLLRVIVLGLFVFIFATSLIGNGQGQIPYLFFWQS